MINGINVTEAILESPANRMRLASEAKALGVTHVRVEIPWVVVQPVNLAWPNGYDWAATDDMLKAFVNVGLKVCVVLGVHRAPWQTLTMPDVFSAMCATVVNRYRWWIDTWEIWNEQNNAAYWSSSSWYGLFNSGPKASEYVPYLKAAYQWIHVVQPNAKVLFGGMAANQSYWNPWSGNVSRDPVDFLNECYAAGAKGYFDGLAYHPYPMDESFALEQEPTATQPFIAKIAALTKVMADNNDVKPIHLTEWGFGLGTDELKAARIAKQYPIHFMFPGVVSNYLYSLRDWDVYPFGLLRLDWTHKPAYDVYKSTVQGA